MAYKLLRYCFQNENNVARTNKLEQFRGWVKFIRRQKDLTFIGITDGSAPKPLQVVVSSKSIPSGLSYGSCIEVNGHLTETGRPKPPIEVQAQSVNVLGECNAEIFSIKKTEDQGLDYYRQFLHLRPRTKFFSSVLRMRSAASHAVHRFFQENDFVEIHTPVLTSNDCEGAGEVFQIAAKGDSSSSDSDREHEGRFFRQPINLTVSGQLHLEAITGGFQRVYTFGPTFRADSSRSRHHLAEFYMIEAEEAFIQSTEEVCEAVEDCLQSVTEQMVHQQSEDFSFLSSQCEDEETHMNAVEKLIEKRFIRMSYSDAIKILQNATLKFQFLPKWGCDLQKEHEKYIVGHCENFPVFVTDFPSSIKPFYARENDDNKTVAAFDLLLPNVGEVCGGSLREERYDVLLDKMKKTNIPADDLKWYLDLREYGSAPHGGFGIGFERYLQFLLGISNIKDVVPFPRTYHSCKL